MLKRNKIKNRRGQIFIFSVILAVTGALISSYILLKYMYEPKNPDEFLGSYQSGIIDALADGDKTLLYVDQAAKMAVDSAFEEYINSNSPKRATSMDSSEEGITEEEISKQKNCGNYVYKLWNNEDTNCYPEDYNSKDFELSSLINNNLITFNYMKTDMKEPLYVNKILQQTIQYTYRYDPSVESTRIYGLTNDKYTIGIFRDEETKKNSEIQQYLDSKNTYSGNLIWPIKGDYPVISCFGFRGKVKAGAGIRASVNHGGIDIAAPLNTPVYAAAAGVIPVEPTFPAWGVVTIDHGNGLKTVYRHMNRVDVKQGDRVTQGQQIGLVGGRSGTKENIHNQNGDYNNYGPHLHFDLISSNIDPNTKYDGINAVVISRANERYVNPLCFMDPEEVSKIPIVTDSLACNSICYQEGDNFVFDKNRVKCTCSADDSFSKDSCAAKTDSDLEDSAPFKFCSVYKGVVANDVPCAKSSKADWEIVDVKLHSTSLKSDQTLKITMTIKNKGDVCVNVKQRIEFVTLDDSSDVTFIGEGGSTNVYKATDTVPYATSELSCTFTSDATLREEGEKAGKCILWSPNDNKPAKYTISTLSGVDYKDEVKEYKDNKFTFTVTKASTDSTNSGNNFVVSNIQLTPGEQATIDKTRENLEKLGVMDEISEQARDTGIPESIILATITLESVGENKEIDIPKTATSGNRAIGIKQVEGWQHYDKIASLCGKDYVAECEQYTKCDLTKAATETCSKDLADACKFTKFHDDPSCQIKVGVMILKKNFDSYGNNDAAYIKAVNSKRSDGTFICDNEEFRNKYLTYTEYQRALRAYNGFGCAPGLENYVERVMKYASGWGYRSEYVSIAKDEADKGILATYKIVPTFSVALDFDLTLFNKLRDFANQTILECGKENQDRKACVQKSITEFNDELSPLYGAKSTGVILSTTCDNSPKEAAIAKFVEELDNCAASSDTNCQCVITPSDEELEQAESIGEYTRFRYASEKGEKELYLDYNITKDNVLVSEKGYFTNSLYVKELPTYKDNEGNLIIGTTSSSKVCTPVKNRFRFCLKTNYKYTIYDPINENVESKSIVIPFALIIRNQIPPAPVTGISAENLEHAKDSVILKWDKNIETDVVKYNIYLANDKTVFERTTTNIKKSSVIIPLSSNENSYEEYKDINTINPTCKINTVDNVDYCTFEYTAKDKDDKDTIIELKSNVLYYLSQPKKFMYIINNTDTETIFTTGTETFIAITATDIDSNEISNADGSSYVLDQNLINITPQDNLEAGFTKIIKADVDEDNKILTVSWTPVTKYIDGTEITDTSNIVYSLYLFSSSSCSKDLYPVNQNNGLINKYTQSENMVDISNRMQGDYCIGISTNKTKEYPFVFLSSITIPEMP